jgi:glutathione synthase/RimK-type ligase-like ATP-grasp enzyme
MSEHPYLIPEWTDSRDTAATWIRENGWTIVCRTKLKAHSGAGIVLSTTVDELVSAPLYVRYIPKKDEYRIHVFDNEVIDVQKKAKRRDVEQPNYKIRNLANGFVYVRDGVEPPDCVRTVAVECMRLTGLVFGAVDVVYNAKHNRAFVLEVNSAPGLEGQTIQSYANAFNRLRGN